jgi:hypothetical protein
MFDLLNGIASLATILDFLARAAKWLGGKWLPSLQKTRLL